LFYRTDVTKLMVAFHSSASAPKTNHLMLYREIIAVCSQIRTKHTNTLCGQNIEFLNVALGGTYNDHWRYI